MMFAASFTALALAVVGANAHAYPHPALIIHTPGAGLTECQKYQLSWEGNRGPVQILVYPAGVTSGEPIEVLPIVSSGTTINWLVDVPADLSYTFGLHDLTTGQIAFTAPALVAPNPSGDTSCEGKNTQGDPTAD